MSSISADPSDASTPGIQVYDIGANFCLERNQQVIIRCNENPSELAYPNFNRTWSINDIIIINTLNGRNPGFEADFFTTGNNDILVPGLILPQVVGFDRFFTAELMLDTGFFNLSNPAIAPPGVDKSNFRDVAYAQLLGVYQCQVRNAIGVDTATSIVRECGKSLGYYCASTSNTGQWHGILL